MVIVQSTWIVQGVHGQCPDCPLSPWTMSTEWMDNVHWIHGHCPVWLVSLDFVHGLTGLCPQYPWTLSRLSTESMVNVHWVHGQCPGSPLSSWTFYRPEMIKYSHKEGVKNCFRTSRLFIFHVKKSQNMPIKWWNISRTYNIRSHGCLSPQSQRFRKRQ